MSTRVKAYGYDKSLRFMNRQLTERLFYPSIMAGWDSTPRRGANGIIVEDNTPEAFAAGLEELVKVAEQKLYEDRLICLNAWNEWAEGNYLQPDSKNGLAFLKNALKVNTGTNS